MKLQKLPPPPPLTEYEKLRAVTVKRNNEVFFALNLPTLSSEVRNSILKDKSKKKKHVQEGSDEEYDPAVDLEDGGSGTQRKAASKDGGSGTEKVCHKCHKAIIFTFSKFFPKCFIGVDSL